MKLCPIAYWQKHSPNALAIDDLTYAGLHQIVDELAQEISLVHNPLLLFQPKANVEDIALFFAAWRAKKTVFPLSTHLPSSAIKERLALTGGEWWERKRRKIKAAEEGQPGTLFETSSSKKIAYHHVEAHLSSAASLNPLLNCTEKSTCCLALPLYHIAGLAVIVRTFVAGARLVFKEKVREATHISLVPTQLYRLESELSHCECILLGGAPLPRFSESLSIYSSYGMTEAASTIALKPPKGKTTIAPHLQVRLARDGEILLDGSSLFQNYWGQPQREGWFATNDLGTFEKGELKILGRKDRQFISGGENIQPAEIEKLLMDFPEVLEARVSPKEDREFGTIPIAELQVKNPLSKEEVVQRLEKLLPLYKIPKEIFLSTLPLQGSKLAKMSMN